MPVCSSVMCLSVSVNQCVCLSFVSLCMSILFSFFKCFSANFCLFNLSYVVSIVRLSTCLTLFVHSTLRLTGVYRWSSTNINLSLCLMSFASYHPSFFFSDNETRTCFVLCCDLMSWVGWTVLGCVLCCSELNWCCIVLYCILVYCIVLVCILFHFIVV